MKLKDRVCLITNCGEFMGPADSLEFQKEGAILVLQSKRLDYAKKILTKFGVELGEDNVLTLESDFGQLGNAEKCLDLVAEKFGHVDVVVNNNPSVTLGKSIVEVSYDEWRSTYHNLVDELFLTTKAALIHMIPRKRGKIVIVASASGIDPIAEECAYSSARGAAIVFTQALGREVAKYNIQVNAIAQTATENPTYFSEEKLSDYEFMNRVKEKIPLGRIAKSWEQARLAVYLASEDSDFLCGSVIRFNGGAFV